MSLWVKPGHSAMSAQCPVLSGHGSGIYENTPWHIGMSPASAAEGALKFKPGRRHK
jgi:hypothetical protein